MLLNFEPRLTTLDVEVQIRNIKNPADEYQDPARQSKLSKNKLLAAHVLCAETDQAAVNLALCNTYGKTRKASQAARNLPKGQTMKYVSHNITGAVKLSPKLFHKLQKTRMLHSWNQKNYNSTAM